mmetsp:Transcript_118832/g.206961  ORF Transcript_118832/g.206961 Transcript_118832/m.206961 type:complete len:233 (-) Transcript_118832:438-1136(-)
MRAAESPLRHPPVGRPAEWGPSQQALRVHPRVPFPAQAPAQPGPGAAAIGHSGPDADPQPEAPTPAPAPPGAATAAQEVGPLPRPRLPAAEAQGLGQSSRLNCPTRPQRNRHRPPASTRGPSPAGRCGTEHPLVHACWKGRARRGRRLQSPGPPTPHRKPSSPACAHFKCAVAKGCHQSCCWVTTLPLQPKSTAVVQAREAGPCAQNGEMAPGRASLLRQHTKVEDGAVPEV